MDIQFDLVVCFQEKLKLVSVMGAGLLVGTSLAVIIPEGVHTLYSTEEHSTYFEFVSKNLPFRFDLHLNWTETYRHSSETWNTSPFLFLLCRKRLL